MITLKDIQSKHKEIKDFIEKEMGREVYLFGTVGSQALNLQTEESDVDLACYYIPTKKELFFDKTPI